MAKAVEKPATDVGAIVGRFQVEDLHEGHKGLIDFVFSRHEKVLIFLGLCPAKSTFNDPLDFETRKQMILAKYPNAIVLYQKDQFDDKVWSSKLDEQIEDVTSPTQTVTLYGSRDSFISHYHGKHDCIEMEQEVFVSGTDTRKKISNKVKGTSEFRAGAIWATSNQWPKALPTIDVAIFNDDFTKVLLARKPNESAYRFVGGFVQPGHTLEQTVRKEVMEETHLEVSEPEYIGSAFIDDWRYRGQTDKIVTSFFAVKQVYGKPTPDDDICELRWFPIDNGCFLDLDGNEKIVENHKQLVEKMEKWLQSKLTK